MAAFLAGLIVAAIFAGLIWLLVKRHLHRPWGAPDGAGGSVRQSSRTSAVASSNVTVNVQQVDAGTLAAMCSALAAAASQGHSEIPVPSARALDMERERLTGITDGSASHSAAIPCREAPARRAWRP